VFRHESDYSKAQRLIISITLLRMQRLYVCRPTFLTASKVLTTMLFIFRQSLPTDQYSTDRL
jgi:hypothetical protein